MSISRAVKYLVLGLSPIRGLLQQGDESRAVAGAFSEKLAMKRLALNETGRLLASRAYFRVRNSDGQCERDNPIGSLILGSNKSDSTYINTMTDSFGR